MISKPCGQFPLKKLLISFIGILFILGTFINYISPNTPDLFDIIEFEKSEFEEFLSAYSKSYSSYTEYNQRFKTFIDNKAFIKVANSMNAPVMLGINCFADLTPEEFKLKVLSTKVPILDFNTKIKIKQIKAPTSVDWVSKGAVTPVVNQGECGSPEVFSAVDSISSAWFLSGHLLTQLSYQQVIDCALKGCSGGSVDQVYQYVIKNGGITSNAIYPSSSGICNSNKAKQVVAKISSYTNVPASNMNALQNAVALQPVTAYVDASTWQFYSSGIISSNCGTSLNHVALITGYQTQSSPSYWVLKNSWGTSWGMGGYIQVAITSGSGLCGINLLPAYPVV